MHHRLRGEGGESVGCYKRIPPRHISLSVSLGSKNHTHTHTNQTLLSCPLSYGRPSALHVCVSERKKTEEEQTSTPRLPQAISNLLIEEDLRAEQGGRQRCNRVNCRASSPQIKQMATDSVITICCKPKGNVKQNVEVLWLDKRLAKL